MRRKKISMVVLVILLIGMLPGCGKAKFSPDNEISVITRESGSGTRGAFIELFGIEQKNSEGKKIDYTIASALTNDKTGIVLTTVSTDTNAIGYVSLGSLNDSVKALEIEGAAATVENVKNGSYQVARPFVIATKEGLSKVGKDFVAFILSKQGQDVVENAGYIRLDKTQEYSGSKPSGKIQISGSSSVTPVMEKLKEAYAKVNENATIEINMTDSTSGMTAAADGTSDIGMASRKIKDSELEKGLIETMIATDGIAVIVNKSNTVNGLSIEDVKNIYTGEITKWNETSVLSK